MMNCLVDNQYSLPKQSAPARAGERGRRRWNGRGGRRGCPDGSAPGASRARAWSFCPAGLSRTVTLLGCLLLLGPSALCARTTDTPAPFAPMAVCPIGAAEPIVDGDLSDPIWRQAAMLGPFVAVATHDLPTQTTHCRAIRAAECLFVSFECYEADMSNLCMDVSESDDSRAWADDCVHLFIAPDDPRNQYYHVVVTAANVVLDESVREAAQDRQPNWDGEIRSATRHLEDRWTCEVALPFAPLTGSSPTGGVWSVNVGRAERAHGEWSSWAPLDASFHEFANFGSLLWSDGPVVTGIDIPAPFIGRNEFRLCIGVVAEPCVAELQAIRGDEVFPKLPVPLSGDVAAAWGYEITSEGRGAVRLVVHSPDGSQTYYASAPVAFDVPALSGLLRGVEARLTELRRECRSLESEGLRELLERDIEWLAEDTGGHTAPGTG